MKTEHQTVASGLSVSYNLLANDSEGVNFSSLRGFVIAERDRWIVDQENEKEDFIRPVFREWLRMSIFSQVIRLPLARFNTTNSPYDPRPKRQGWCSSITGGFAAVGTLGRGGPYTLTEWSKLC